MANPSPDLETAKARLRDVLSYLENVVEKRMSEAKNIATADNQESLVLQSLQSENKHLKEELGAAQKQAGEASIRFNESEKRRKEASSRVHKLIESLEGAA